MAAAEARPGAAGRPSAEKQKQFITDNQKIQGLLNIKTCTAIRDIIMMEVGTSVILDTGPAANEVDIDLDELGRQNEDVLFTIYGIVWSRREALRNPA